MIKSFRSKALKQFAATGDPSKLPVPKSADRLRRQLMALNDAVVPEEMNLPGWYFHGLQSKPKRWSVRVTGNWRLTFGFDGQDAEAVDLDDYH